MNLPDLHMELFKEIYEIFADYEDLDNQELIVARDCIHKRLKKSLDIIDDMTPFMINITQEIDNFGI